MENEKRFYTPIEGMEGVGVALVSHASVSIEEGKSRRPEQPSGGTYSNMQVKKEIMEAIQKGNGGSLFYFEEVPGREGYYSMHPTYPELGANTVGGEQYKIRENVNWLYKGIASHFVNRQGDVDYRSGTRFMKEFAARFPDSKSLEDPLLSAKDVEQENISWLCDELRIPEEEKEDFSRFAQNCIYSSTCYDYAFGWGDFFDVMVNWAYAGLLLEEKPENDMSPDLLNAVSPGFERSKQEILDLAGIDPKTERRMIILTECSGSAAINSKLFARGYNVSQDGRALGRFICGFDGAENKLIERRNDLKKELQNMADNPIEKAHELFERHCQEIDQKIKDEKTDPEERNRLSEELSQLQSGREEASIRLLNQRVSQASEELLTLQEEIDRRSIEDPNTTLKWLYHEATNAASFELEQSDGTKKTYYITLEGFAPEENVIMDHAGMSTAVSIGIYGSEEEFNNYYLQDHARIRKDDPLLQGVHALKTERVALMRGDDIFDFPEELNTWEIREQYRRMRDDWKTDMNMAYYGADSDWKKGLERQAERRRPMMGIDIQNANSLYEPEHERLVRRADAFASRIPEELRPQYKNLVEAYRHLNRQVREVSNRELFIRSIAAQKDEQLEKGEIAPEEEERVRTEIARLNELREKLEKRSMEGYMAREVATRSLESILMGNTYERANEEEKLSFDQATYPYGLTAESVISLVGSAKDRILPVTEVSMDVQEAIPGLAASLIETEDFRYAQQTVVDFAADNFDSALQGAFLPDEQKTLNAMGMELYSQILVDGRPVSQLLDEKYGPENVNHNLAKCEILAATFRDCKIEFALGMESEEKGGRVPLNMHSKIPAVQESLERVRQARKQEREEQLRGRSEDWDIPRRGSLPERPSLSYVEMPLKYGVFEKNARLRDYDFDMETGNRTVKDGEKIGQPIKKGESIRIIYPLVESEDKKWVQAMGQDGTCGYIRKSRVDMAQLASKASDAKPLPRYRFEIGDEELYRDIGVQENVKRIPNYDPTFVIDKKTKVIETSMSKQHAASHRWRFLYYEAKSSGRIFSGSLGESFDEAEASYGVRFSAEDCCRQRVRFKMEAMTALEKDTRELNSDQSRNNAMMIVAETDHKTTGTREWMAEELSKGEDGALKNVGVIYVEDFMTGKDQEELDAYLNGGEIEMPYGLQCFCSVEDHKGFKEFLESVKEHNTVVNEEDRIRIVAIGSELAQSNKQVERAAKFNYAAREIIDANLPQLGKRGLIYAGGAHALTHPGLEDGKVILGFSQLYNQDALVIQKNGDSTKVITLPKDEILRGRTIQIAEEKTTGEKTAEGKPVVKPISNSVRKVSYSNLTASDDSKKPKRVRSASEAGKQISQKEHEHSKGVSTR